MSEPTGTYIDQSQIFGPRIGLSIDADNVFVTRSLIQGNILGVEITGGSNQSFVGNTIIGGMRIGPSDGPPTIHQLTSAIGSIEDQLVREKLLNALDIIISSKGSGERTNAYVEFVQNLANHITILAPFLPAIGLVVG